MHVQAQQDEHLEKPRARGPAGHRDARGVDKRCRFYPTLSRYSSRRHFHMWHIEGNVDQLADAQREMVATARTA